MNKNPLGVKEYVDELIECGNSLPSIIGKVEEDLDIDAKEFVELVETCVELKTALYARFPYAYRLLKPFEVAELDKGLKTPVSPDDGDDELAELREAATSMGIRGANLMKAETLKRKIAKMQGQVEDPAAENEEAETPAGETNGEQESENITPDA